MEILITNKRIELTDGMSDKQALKILKEAVSKIEKGEYSKPVDSEIKFK